MLARSNSNLGCHWTLFMAGERHTEVSSEVDEQIQALRLERDA